MFSRRDKYAPLPLLFQLLLFWLTKVSHGFDHFKRFLPYSRPPINPSSVNNGRCFWGWIQQQLRWQMGLVSADSCQVIGTFTTIGWQGQANSSRQMQPLCERGRLEASELCFKTEIYANANPNYSWLSVVCFLPLLSTWELKAFRVSWLSSCHYAKQIYDLPWCECTGHFSCWRCSCSMWVSAHCAV